MGKTKKTKVKIAGLKSSFVVEDKGIMTAFGRGNKAIVEKRIQGDTVKNVQKSSKYSVDFGEKVYLINKNENDELPIMSDDPKQSKKAIGMDAIRCKDELEKRYFGKTFNDNIHIQLIYCILDIEKILAVHANNIVYTIDNLRRVESDEYDDFIGYLSTVNSYETFCNPEKLLPGKNQSVYDNINNSRKTFKEYLQNRRLSYFGKVFYVEENDPKKKDKKIVRLRDEKDIYYIFALLGGVRQFCAHDKNRGRSWLYTLKDNLNDDAKKVLDSFYEGTIKSLNDDFLYNSSQKDLPILFEVLDAEEDLELKKNIARWYYAFTCKKNFKNIGFSITLLREKLLETKFAELKKDSYNSVRSKMYRLLDFIIYMSYKDERLNKDNDEAILKIVDKLRAALNEDEKEEIYNKEAARLYDGLKGKIELLKAGVEKIKKSQPFEEIDQTTRCALRDAIENNKIQDSGDYFTKLIYLMTLLIDGKEINDLLTTLIHKFENIGAFLDVMKNEKIEGNLKPEFEFFKNSNKIAGELRSVNSFARMTGFMQMDSSTKFILFREAADILGTEYTDDEIKEHLNLEKQGKTGTGFRNFIVSNVIKSSRFKYLVRYSNPKKVREVAKNEKLISYVLGTLPESQIERYCNTCKFELSEKKEENIEKLTKVILNMDFSQFEKVPQQANVENNDEQAVEKAKMQGTISLYLTMLYLLVKNLVYVNSRYFMAFHCLERDSQLKGIATGYNGTDYSNLTMEFINNGYLNPRASEYLLEDIDNSDNWSIRKFRNCVAHMNSVRNLNTYVAGLRRVGSYYDIYAYATQNYIKSYFAHDVESGNTVCRDGNYVFKGDTPINAKTIGYFDLLEKYGTYNKDFMKALCTPFGYNLPRFKNLAIEALFDKNNTRFDEGEKEWKKEK